MREVFSSYQLRRETGPGSSLFVLVLRQRAGVAEGEAPGQDGDGELAARLLHDLGDALAQSLVLPPFLNAGPGHLQIDDAGRAAVVDLENVVARLGADDGADAAGLEREDLVLEHL